MNLMKDVFVSGTYAGELYLWHSFSHSEETKEI